MPTPIETLNQKINHINGLLSLLDTFGKDDFKQKKKLLDQKYWLEVEKKQLLEKEAICKNVRSAEQK